MVDSATEAAVDTIRHYRDELESDEEFDKCVRLVLDMYLKEKLKEGREC